MQIASGASKQKNGEVKLWDSLMDALEVRTTLCTWRLESGTRALRGSGCRSGQEVLRQPSRLGWWAPAAPRGMAFVTHAALQATSPRSTSVRFADVWYSMHVSLTAAHARSAALL